MYDHPKETAGRRIATARAKRAECDHAAGRSGWFWALSAAAVVFLLAAAWVLRRDFRACVTNVQDGLRTPWSELSAEEHV